MISRMLNHLDWGVQADMSSEENTNIRIVNFLALLATVSALPFIFIYSTSYNQISILHIISCCVYLTTLLWNTYEKYTTAKFWLITAVHINLFISASTFGRLAGEHLILIPIIFAYALIFQFSEKVKLSAAFSITIITSLTLEFTSYSLFKIPLNDATLIDIYRGNLLFTVLISAIIAGFYYYLHGRQKRKNQEIIRMNEQIEETIHYYSESKYGDNTIDDVLWDVAKNCISRFNLEDCVIYIYDKEKNLLTQKAAFGDKNPYGKEIYNPLEVPLGSGIVGTAAQYREAIIIDDTTKDSRYIKDDKSRLSEIAVPIQSSDELLGVLDSEHSEKNFFNEKHLRLFKTIAAICSTKMISAIAEQERKKALKVRMQTSKIRAINNLRTQLFSDISNELKDPITLLNNVLDNKNNISDDDCEKIRKYSQKLNSLLNQLRDLSKLESGSYSLNFTLGDLTSLIDTHISIYHSVLEDEKKTLSTSLPSSTLWLRYDKNTIDKILQNLFSLARILSTIDSTIKFEAKYEQGLQLKITYETAYTSDDQNNESSDDRRGKINISLLRELTALHNGELSLNENKNKSSISIYLPLEKGNKSKFAEAEEDEHNNKKPKLSQNEEKILVIDDNLEIAELIKSKLESNYTIFQAKDGLKGLQKANKIIPDLIICDIMMPKMDGLEFCNHIKENEVTSHIPIIFLTARNDSDTKLKSLRLGADGLILKPFDSEELLLKCKNLLDQRKELKEKYQKIISLGSDEIIITSKEEIFIKKLLSSIEENLGNTDYSVNQLCHDVGMSRMQLHRKLTSLTGYPASTFIRRQRLHHAAQLLASGETVSQTAYAVGFNSLSYFSKKFKEMYNLLPSTFIELKADECKKS